MAGLSGNTPAEKMRADQNFPLTAVSACEHTPPPTGRIGLGYLCDKTNPSPALACPSLEFRRGPEFDG
jgi:hypothetical protein